MSALESFHEWPEYCYLYWPTNYVVSNMDTDTSAITIPTNFPTKRLFLVVNDWENKKLNIDLPFWEPGREISIDIIAIRQSGGNTNRQTDVTINGTLAGVSGAHHYTTYSQYRMFSLEWDPVFKVWSVTSSTMPSRPVFYFDGIRNNFPNFWPTTVEDWIRGLHP